MSQQKISTKENKRVAWDDSDAFKVPWMSQIEEGSWVRFTVDRTKLWVERVTPTFSSPVKSDDGMINQGIGYMKDIEYVDSNEQVDIDGEHIVPFWAGSALRKALDASESTKWVDLSVKRETEEKTYPDGEVKTLNSCEMVLSE